MKEKGVRFKKEAVVAAAAVVVRRTDSVEAMKERGRRQMMRTRHRMNQIEPLETTDSVKSILIVSSFILFWFYLKK